MKDFYSINCFACSKPFKARLRHTKYCSYGCRRAVRENPYTSPYTGGIRLPSGTTGAVSELRVCCDLLVRGFEVFRAVSSACSCDLAILKDGKLLRIEVRTGLFHKVTGRMSVRKGKKDEGRSDVVAAVYSDSIVYTPPLESYAIASDFDEIPDPGHPQMPEIEPKA